MLRFKLLADTPDAATTVSQWYYEQWCKDSGRYTFAEVHNKVSAAQSRLGPPLIVLAYQAQQLIGAAELKRHEMDCYPDYEYWLGGVFVAQNYRGKQIASELVKQVIKHALHANITTLYLQTENHSGGLYQKLGFKPMERKVYKGVDILVMKAELFSLR